MKHRFYVVATLSAAALAVFFLEPSFARGPGGGFRGGGGGGGMRSGGGGGISRPPMGGGGGMSRPPMGGGGGMSRPPVGGGRSPSISPPVNRPGGAPARPGQGGGASRPTTPGTRPSNLPSTRPPSGGLSNSANRPGAGNSSASRRGSTTVFGPGGRPSSSQLNDFLDVPRPSNGVRNGVGNFAAGAAGGAAADFLRDSRPGNMGERPEIGNGGRPSTNDRPGLSDRPGTAERPGLNDRPGVADRVSQGGRPEIGDGTRVDNAQQRRSDRVNNRPDRIENREERMTNRQDRRDEIWDQIEDNYPRLDFWTDHPNWARWRINAPYRWATWGALTGWFGYTDYAATDYSYGSSCYYEDGYVYSGGQQVATAEEYAQQAETIATSAPEADPATKEWMPLGVFAVTQDGQANGPTPSLFLQLVVSRDGVLSGTFDNKLTNATKTIEGMIDKKSQRVAWCVQGESTPIMETGLENLTKDTAPVLIHFADGQTQQWLLVRLKDPADKK